MKTQNVKEQIAEVGATWEEFQDFMFGQTYGINDDGSENWYEYDVTRFIRAKRREQISREQE